ncbi:hypothetical protein AVT69_gp309 [Pseudomonas phage PhiPA3]|uniref:Uncharacterized protein 311 n=1 Tax=Pseudomonas phage PhiPA3 TaxID=998086 RepID=F8SJE7_BPPA3|nr:hypothetical protein AVT69_gp309 [Pseudomonas phage PhiPA3]AEH03734.1 hypothetical protein [Pseudomonas phage PhiPA3]
MEEIEMTQAQENKEIVRTSYAATVLAGVVEFGGDLLRDVPSDSAAHALVPQAIAGTLDAVQNAYHLVPKIEYVGDDLRDREAPVNTESTKLSGLLDELWDKVSG